jgi:hypothetical protein
MTSFSACWLQLLHLHGVLSFGVRLKLSLRMKLSTARLTCEMLIRLGLSVRRACVLHESFLRREQHSAGPTLEFWHDSRQPKTNYRIKGLRLTIKLSP